jgi:hypothetical protein
MRESSGSDAGFASARNAETVVSTGVKFTSPGSASESVFTGQRSTPHAMPAVVGVGDGVAVGVGVAVEGGAQISSRIVSPASPASTAS